jgi:hypothetical protein
MKIKEVKDKLSKSQNRYEQLNLDDLEEDGSNSNSDEDEFSFEMQKSTY